MNPVTSYRATTDDPAENHPAEDYESTASTACPSEAFWRGFLNGDSSCVDVAEMDSHLAVCDGCRNLLDELSSDHWLSPLLQERLTAHDAPPALPRPDFAPAGAIPGIRLLRVIGTGGMGVVYAAIDEATKTEVACKILARQRPTAEERSRFRREVAAIQSLEHPHIVKLLGSGEVDDTLYFVMEYVANGTLDQRLRAQTLPPRDAARFLAKVARAVAYAHEHGVVHRDLKPANILLGGSRQSIGAEVGKSHGPLDAWIDLPPKIADFGLAKLSGNSTQWTRSGQILGTPAYAAPEQMSGQANLEPDERCDVYSLGAILYQLITGVPPLQADTVLQTVRLVMEVEPTPPRRLRPRVPYDLETICLRCLEKNPAARYPSAVALADDLDRFLERRPIASRRPSRLSRLAKWTWRNPWKAASLALVAILALGAMTAPTIMAMHYREVEQLQRKAAVASERGRNLAEKNLHRAWVARSRYLMAEGDDVEALRYLTAVFQDADSSEQTRVRIDSILRELPSPALRVMLPIGEQPATLGPPLGQCRIHASVDGGKLCVQRLEAPGAWAIEVATGKVTTVDLGPGPVTEDLQWRLEGIGEDSSLRLAPLAAGPPAVELERPAVLPSRWLRLSRSADGQLAAALGRVADAANANANANAIANGQKLSGDANSTRNLLELSEAATGSSHPYVWHLWRLPEGRLLRPEGYPMRAANAEMDLEREPMSIISPHDVRGILRQDGRLAFEMESLQPVVSDLTPDRRMIATADGFLVKAHLAPGLDHNAIQRAVDEVPLPSCLRFSRVCQFLAVGSMDGHVRSINLMIPGLSRASALSRRGAIRWLRFDEQLNFLLVADDRGNVAVVDGMSGSVVVPWIPHRRPLLDVAWTPRGDFAVLDESGLLTLWRWPRVPDRVVDPSEDSLTSARIGKGPLLKSFNERGDRLLVSQRDFAEIWDVPGRRVLRRFSLPTGTQVRGVAAMGNTFAIASGDGQPEIFPSFAMIHSPSPSAAVEEESSALVTHQLLALDEHQTAPQIVDFRMRHRQPVVLLANRDGQRWIIATAAGLEIWKVGAAEREALLVAGDPVAATISPQRRELAVLMRDGRLGIWDLDSRREIAGWVAAGRDGGKAEPGVRMMYSPNGDRLFVYGRLGLRGWMRSDGRRIALPAALGQWTSHLALDREGRYALTVRDAAIAQVWDTTGPAATHLWQPVSIELRASGCLAEAQFGPGANQVVLRQASTATTVYRELYRVPALAGSLWLENEQFQIWDWRLGEPLTSRHLLRDFSHDWLADNGRWQLVGLTADSKLRWPKIEMPATLTRERLELLARQFLHATRDIDSARPLEPVEIVNEWQRLKRWDAKRHEPEVVP